MKVPRFLFLTLALLAALLAVPGASTSSVDAVPFISLDDFKDFGLGGPSALAVSSDGLQVYLACQHDESLGIFSRDPASGRLDLLSVEPLESTNAMLFSSDGVYLYTASPHSLSVFQRDPASGALTHLQTVFDFVVTDLSGASKLALSPDETFLYVTAAFDDAIIIFSRDPVNGQITFVDSAVEGVDGVQGLNGVTSLAISPDGAYLYAAGMSDSTLAIFSRNPTTGLLTYLEMLQDGVGGVDGLAEVRDVAISPDGANVYTAAMDDDAIGIFSRATTTGRLTYRGMFENGRDSLRFFRSPIAVSVTPDGSQVIAAAFTDGTVASFRRLPGGGDLEFATRLTDNREGVDGLHGVRELAFSPGGEHLYAAAYYDHSLVAIRREAAHGWLEFIEQHLNATGLGGTGGLAVSPDGRSLLVTGNNDDAVVVFARDPQHGRLSYSDYYADGEYSYDGLDGARAVAISPGSDYAYIAGHDEDAVAIFELLNYGALLFQEVVRDGVSGMDALNGVQAMAISPDGSFLYTAAEAEDAIGIFQRDQTSGLLTFGGVVRDGVGGVDGLDGVYSLAISPDGWHLLATGYYDHAVVVFRRDPVSGGLSFEQVLKDGEAGIDGLNGANSIGLSPDMRQVYVASRGDDALAVFSYDPAIYRLSPLEVHKEGVDGLDGLDGARAVGVCPDGSCVAVASQYDHTLLLFQRDRSTGRLVLQKVFRDSLNAGSLSVADALAFSQDGSSLYVSGYGDNGIAFFQRIAFLYLPQLIDP